MLRIIGPPSPGGSFDAARVAAEVVTALYQLVEKEGHSAEEVAFRVRSLSAEQPGQGDASQAAIEVHMGRGEPGHVAIELNLSLYDNALRVRLLARIEEVTTALVASAGATLRVRTDYALPAVVNDDRVTGAVERAARHVIGESNIITNWRNRFADDVGLLFAGAPGCLMLLGTGNPDKAISESWHRPGFDIDEDALSLGVHIMSLAALELLR